MMESVGKGMAALFAFCVLSFIVFGREADIKREKLLIQQDPVAVARTEYDADEFFFYRIYGVGKYIKVGDAWSVAGEDSIPSVLLDMYPERRDMALSEDMIYTAEDEYYRRKAHSFSIQFNREMARLLLREVNEAS